MDEWVWIFCHSGIYILNADLAWSLSLFIYMILGGGDTSLLQV